MAAVTSEYVDERRFRMEVGHVSQHLGSFRCPVEHIMKYRNTMTALVMVTVGHSEHHGMPLRDVTTPRYGVTPAGWCSQLNQHTGTAKRCATVPRKDDTVPDPVPCQHRVLDVGFHAKR